MFTDATPEEILNTMDNAYKAFSIYRNCTLHERAGLMRSIAKAIEELGDALIITAAAETNLPEARLRNERTRTVFQLNSYADACERGDWLEASIDSGDLHRTPAKPDIRKMLVPLGPVVVFGAANFPLAYSTAGGDTACALAAGCPVIVKAHPAHAATSEMVASAVRKAVTACGIPDGVFSHLHGASFDVGKALVENPNTAAVGFTGSQAAGKQLFDWASQRKKPIPVFAEMSSINPVFLFPQKMKEDAAEVAKMMAASITLGAGQFCTNPGLIIAIDDEHTKTFIKVLGEEISQIAPATMLHPGIYKNYSDKKADLLSQPGVKPSAAATIPAKENQAAAMIAISDAQHFMQNPALHQEVFGPFSLIILCKDLAEMEALSFHMDGQLTASVMATHEDILANIPLMDQISNCCGRFILNSVPTGVEVCLSMQHGGPYPATTDSRFTAVGADGIKRFARPLAYQNWSNEWLPDELKDENPLGIWRMVDDERTKQALE